MRADRQRLDKWLWFAVSRSPGRRPRSSSASGFVRVNGQRSTDPAKALAVGDVVTVALERATLVVRVVERSATRRGPASEARQLYVDLDSDDGTLVTGPDSG